MSDKEKLAQWMMKQGYATGHGDTIEDLLHELEWQIAENWKWVGLTDEEVKYIADSEWEEAFVRLVEAKLKEKNQ